MTGSPVSGPNQPVWSGFDNYAIKNGLDLNDLLMYMIYDRRL